MTEKIPRKIHYCWFGGNPLPEMMQRCIDSWKKYCPDYEIVEWNEHNFDLNCCQYVKEAYEAKKWAFVSDVARLYALVNQGGIYMDTDVELLKPIDDILHYDAVAGFETDRDVATAFLACTKEHPVFVEMYDGYNNTAFIKDDGSFDLTPNVARITNICLKYGMVQNNDAQTINGLTIFPKDYFCAKDFETKEVRVTKNTYSIHHFDGSWLTDEQKYMAALSAKYRKFMPKKLALYYARFRGICKFRGFKSAIKETFKWATK